MSTPLPTQRGLDRRVNGRAVAAELVKRRHRPPVVALVEDMMTTTEVAQRLGLARRAARDWLRHRGIRPLGRQGGRWGENVYPAVQIMGYLQQPSVVTLAHAVRYGELSTQQRERLVGLLIAIDAVSEPAHQAAAHKIATAYGELLATVEQALPARPRRHWVACLSGVCEHSGEPHR